MGLIRSRIQYSVLSTRGTTGNFDPRDKRAKIEGMSAPNGAVGQLATPSELLLLRAALLEKSQAAEAAMTWLRANRAAAGSEFHGLESGSRRLLPLVYRNVKEFLPREARHALRKVHQEYWSKNQQQFHRLEEVLGWFESCAIPTLVLKGAALSVLHYADRAVRPMSDVDILVPESQAREIVLSLQSEGWTTPYFAAKAPRNRYFLRHVHAIELNHEDQGTVDLHWHVLHAATFPGADRSFWEASVPLSFNNVATRALNPTDQLLHACIHGYAGNHVAPIRWIADACTVLATSQIDWDRLVRLSGELHVTIPLGAALAFLRDAFSAAIPDQVISQLASIPVRPSEQRYFARLFNMQPRWHEIFADNYERHRRANPDVPPIMRLATLPRQFQLHYNLLDFGDLKSFTMSLLRKRFTRMLGTS